MAIVVLAFLAYHWVPVLKSYEPGFRFMYDAGSQPKCGVLRMEVTPLLQRYGGLLPSKHLYGNHSSGVHTGTLSIRIDFVGGEAREVHVRRRPRGENFEVKAEVFAERMSLALFHQSERLLTVWVDRENPDNWTLITED